MACTRLRFYYKTADAVRGVQSMTRLYIGSSSPDSPPYAAFKRMVDEMQAEESHC